MRLHMLCFWTTDKSPTGGMQTPCQCQMYVREAPRGHCAAWSQSNSKCHLHPAVQSSLLSQSMSWLRRMKSSMARTFSPCLIGNLGLITAPGSNSWGSSGPDTQPLSNPNHGHLLNKLFSERPGQSHETWLPNMWLGASSAWISLARIPTLNPTLSSGSQTWVLRPNLCLDGLTMWGARRRGGVAYVCWFELSLGLLFASPAALASPILLPFESLNLDHQRGAFGVLGVTWWRLPQ